VFKHTGYQLKKFIFFSPTWPATAGCDPVLLTCAVNPYGCNYTVTSVTFKNYYQEKRLH